MLKWGAINRFVLYILWDCKLSGLKSLRIVHEQRSTKNFNSYIICLYHQATPFSFITGDSICLLTLRQLLGKQTYILQSV